MELDYARETLAVVQALPDSRDGFAQMQLGWRTQWLYRMILSRLYYAAHHLGRLLLSNVGLNPEQWRGDVHRRVLRELEGRYAIAGIMNANTLDALDRLRRYRIRADYELAFRIRFRALTDALNLFTIYFNECCRILGVT